MWLYRFISFRCVFPQRKIQLLPGTCQLISPPPLTHSRLHAKSSLLILIITLNGWVREGGGKKVCMSVRLKINKKENFRMRHSFTFFLTKRHFSLIYILLFCTLPAIPFWCRSSSSFLFTLFFAAASLSNRVENFYIFLSSYTKRHATTIMPIIKINYSNFLRQWMNEWRSEVGWRSVKGEVEREGWKKSEKAENTSGHIEMIQLK